MKKRIFILLAALLCLVCAFALVSCDEGGALEGETPPACQHRDADDNSLCDKCGESYTDGVDVTEEHTHAYGEWITVTPASRNAATRSASCALVCS